jgi:hypothetical protein
MKQSSAAQGSFLLPAADPLPTTTHKHKSRYAPGIRPPHLSLGGDLPISANPLRPKLPSVPMHKVRSQRGARPNDQYETAGPGASGRGAAR